MQKGAIDVTGWTLDEIFGEYPEGARPKRAYFPPGDSALPDFIRPTRRYLYKRSDRKYPDQFWGEIAAYRVGCILGVEVPPAYAACHTKDGNCGALIEWFYEDGKASFVAGGQYMQRMMPEFDRKKGELHNFQSIRALGRLFGIAALFDALIGNSDRHQDNWGVLIQKQKNKTKIKLSPLFDNGTSLGHEYFTENIQDWKDERYQSYIRRGTHHLRWDKSDAKKCQHLELLVKLQANAGGSLPKLRQKLVDFDMRKLEEELDELCHLEMLTPLTYERKNLYIRLVALRRERILEALK